MLKFSGFARVTSLFLGASVLGASGCGGDDEPKATGPALGTVGAMPGDTASNSGTSTGAPVPGPTSSGTGTGSSVIPSNPPTGVTGSGTATTGTATATGAPTATGTGTGTGVPTNTSTATTSAPSSSVTGVPPDGTGGAPPSSSTPDAAAGSGGMVNPGDPPTTDVPGAGMSKGACTIGAGMQMGEGQTMEQYLGADVTRDGKSYRMITNGWGMNWDSHDISWLGSSMSINTYAGSRQDNGAPAGYPSVFCGRYSDTSLDCGLPKALSSVTALNTAVSWSHPMADGTYNVAYDVWLGDGMGGGFRSLQSYFMVWLKDPADESPAGTLQEEGVTVPNAPGVWNIIAGEVNGLPIVNYVRAEGDELNAMAFDIMDFIRDAQTRNLQFPGNDLLAVAIGFEIWSGPVTGLKLEDFCLDIQ